ncbi:MAG: hypothetical protein HYZ74_09545 [Elusimicrobia bacterium]|nr:hypothetical protein [Elusimicrobiota bacterium]
MIRDRDLPPLLEKILRSYFSVLTDDEKARLLSDLASRPDLAGLTGPEIVGVALNTLGVTGRKIAQVLSVHKGLLPERYRNSLLGSKDRARDINKSVAFDILADRVDRIDRESSPRFGDPSVGDELDALAVKALPDVSLPARGRLLRQVRYLLNEGKRRLSRIESIGTELGSGSIKVAYKLTLDDGKVWVAKIRVPGAQEGVQREFEILNTVVDNLEDVLRDDAGLEAAQARQILDEVRGLVASEMRFQDEAAKESAMVERLGRRSWLARKLAGGEPFVPRPHPLYVDEDVLLEEFAPAVRFADLPRRSMIGPSQARIARLAAAESVFSMVYDDWLEPDPHAGNRMARRAGWLDRLRTKLVLIDLGQGHAQKIERLKPFLKSALALEGGDAASATSHLIGILNVPRGKDADVRAAVEGGFASAQTDGLMERLMSGLLAAETAGALVRPEYASLQKTFLHLTDEYAPLLPRNFLVSAMERALAARILRDRAMSPASLAKLSWKRLIRGRAAVSRELEAVIDRL